MGGIPPSQISYNDSGMAIEFRDKSGADIEGIYKPADAQQETRKNVYSRFTTMRNGRYINGEGLEESWIRWEKQYESRRDPKGDDWQSTIVPPFTTTLIERALAEMIGQTIRPRVIPRGPEDKAKATLMNHIVDYTWERGDGDLQLADSLKQILVLGKTIWQEDFFLDKKEVKILSKMDLAKGTEEYKKKEVFEFNDVYGEKVDLFDFFIDPVAKTVNRGRYKARDCIRRYILDYEMFMQMFAGSFWDQFGATQYVKAGTNADYYRYYNPPTGISQEEVEVLFFWGRVPDKLIIMANDVVIRDGPNPYNHKLLPFAEGSDVTRLNGFWARGEPELLESIQDELTTLRRMRIDRQHLDIHKTAFVSTREIIEDEENIIHPTHMIPVDDPNAVKMLEYSDINPSAYREEELLKEDGRNVTGIMNPQPSNTATEAAIFRETTMKSLQMKIWRVSRELMTDILRLRVPNIVQYYSAPNIENILGEVRSAKFRRIITQDVAIEIAKTGELVEKESKGVNFFDVTPDLVTPHYGRFDLIMTAEPSLPLSKPLRQQKAAEFFQHPVIAAAIQSGYYSIEKAADIMSEVNEFDPDKLRVEGGVAKEGVIDESVMLELANRENAEMLAGSAIGGTPYATKDHTALHLAFMGSEEFKSKFNQQIAEIFTKHILSESKAQEIREQGVPKGPLDQGGVKGVSEVAGIMGGQAKAASPGRVLGKEEIPEGIIPRGATLNL